ncbi:hypothetical protein BaRGS_00027952 [Batillaria attramentaria]|uniref:Uncharacterized protein n=1 Tax=Batillaria attramentaria TaxID=370345 RepID=A0ABD0K0B2_9CAEN
MAVRVLGREVTDYGLKHQAGVSFIIREKTPRQADVSFLCTKLLGSEDRALQKETTHIGEKKKSTSATYSGCREL